MNRDPIEEFGGLHLYSFVLNNGIRTVDPYGLSRYDCSPTSWSGQVAGGYLVYLGVTYSHETEECKCCKPDGSIGSYWRRYTEGTMTLAAGAGFDVNLGTVDWTWNLPFIGPIDYSLNLAFHFSISTVGINYTFTHEMIEDECNDVYTGIPGRICWSPSLDLGVQNIGVGNQNLGIFASAHSRFQGNYCVLLSRSGLSLDDVSGEITATVSAYAALAGSRYYLVDETVQFP